MCNIAGYAGTHPAAPILIEMLRRQEAFDGSASCGITTVHNGRLYTRKVIGNIDTLINTTDALFLPGTVGIAHTRPGGSPEEYNFAHPFVTQSGRISGITNGTTRHPDYTASAQRATEYLEDRGYTFFGGTNLKESGFPKLKNGNYVSCVEVRANLVEAYVNDGMEIPAAMARVTSECYTDSVLGILSLDTPDRFYINRTSRPAYQLKLEHGVAVASCKFAFPDGEGEAAERLPIFTPCIICRDGVTVSGIKMTGVEEVSNLTEQGLEEGYKRISALLRGKESSPLTFDDLELAVWNNMRDLFDGNHTLIQDAMMVYEALFRLHSEGKLKMITKMATPVKRRYYMWIEE